MNTNIKKKPSTTGKVPSRIKNYSSRSDLSSIFEVIRQSLATHKAKRVMFEYDEDGRATSISFMMEVNGERFSFQLPNRFERVKALVLKAYREQGDYIAEDRLNDQAYRTSWANIRDWILAQMALIDSQMVKTEEVFFPYLLDQSGRTAFETFEQRLALPEPGQYRIVEERKT